MSERAVAWLLIVLAIGNLLANLAYRSRRQTWRSIDLQAARSCLALLAIVMFCLPRIWAAAQPYRWWCMAVGLLLAAALVAFVAQRIRKHQSKGLDPSSPAADQ